MLILDRNLLSGLKLGSLWVGNLVGLFSSLAYTVWAQPQTPEVALPFSSFSHSCRDYHLAQSERESPPPSQARPAPQPIPVGFCLLLLASLFISSVSVVVGALEEQLPALWHSGVHSG